VRRRLEGGFELDDDPARIDVDAVHRFLSEQSYWAHQRSREMNERLILEAARVVGLYLGERQIGFARAVTDGVTIAYLADVYVLEEHRGRGFGRELVRETIERGPFAGQTWYLRTDDPGFDRRLGFGPPSEQLMERPAP
jgi:GNAT superfamily N-acetyltransferase